MTGCRYFEMAMDPQLVQDLVPDVIKSIKKSKVQFDFIACTGASGAAIAPIVAYQMKKPLTIIRKESASSHSGCYIAGSYSGTYIIIDDFVSSGKTVRKIAGRLEMARLIAVFSYKYNHPKGHKYEKSETVTVENEKVPVYFRFVTKK